MKVLQILPALDSGGVERGTVDFAKHLVTHGHESVVISSGGRLVEQLEAEGTRHIQYPVHQKSLKSLFRVRGLRDLIVELKPDIIHVRSRIPAWMTRLALRKLSAAQRPALVSTFHGLYSVSPYSAIMGYGDQIIAISACVKEYILKNYPKVNPAKITLVHRGVDVSQFNAQHTANPDWQRQLYREHPQLQEKPLILMPGRLSRWKGQPEFIDTIAELQRRGTNCHGLILGSPTPGKDHYLQELKEQVAQLGLQEQITFLAHSDQIANIYALSSVVCNLSQHAEPFGRTVIEALAMGVPVVSYDYGGPAESLRTCYPQGLVPINDISALCNAIESALHEKQDIQFPLQFTLQHQAEATLRVYEKAIQGRQT
jgi:glycosyltransferase involved in cell wall biosynthesis